MKKLMLVVLLGGFLFTSCQKDDLSTQTELQSVDGKGQDKIKIDNGDDDTTCEVNLLPDLPATVDFCVTDKGTDVSYFDISIAAGDLTGAFSAWCVDQDASLDNGDCVTADVYSSYEEIAASGVIEFPENLPAVNWLINQDVVGQISGTGEAYTMGDVQRAIWALLDDSTCELCTFLPDFDDDRRDALVMMALENNDFEPAEGDLIGIILMPQEGEQTIIFFIPVECEEKPVVGCETAFAKRSESESFCEEYTGKENRWGWNTLLATDGGPYTFDVWAGAGQCDTGKGTLVGTATLTFENGGVSVTTDFGDNTIKEMHVYAGTTPYPKNKQGEFTLAPGKYYVEDLSEVDEAYVILHWGVCGENDED